MQDNGAHNLYFDLVLPRIKAKKMRDVFSVITQFMASDLKHTPKSLTQALHAQLERDNIALGDRVGLVNLKCPNLKFPRILLTTMREPLEFDTPDNKDLDIICFVFSSAEESHGESLRRISRLSRLLKDQDLRAKMMETNDAEAIRSLLMDPDGWTLAAA